ncbi:leucine-rich repeat and fibronectin type-III domain-containing protein 2-like [Mercenaria mercenaria]|uniref:leucine-rich repeat and fibronectin type-III domain-containing protein 2-like n=1 Tax=Mercenaria mercenaria TaxID=6596 RepID=UPI001E1D875C|nr:leucine-rich repeat and fibronectin type-III domain-containing protein 2-like [Mercenaria mercenaria]
MIPGVYMCGIFTMNCWSLSIILILFGLHGFGATASTCPAVCFCPSLTRTVYCPRKELLFIPSGIPSDSIQLNLNDNTFSNPVISKENFTRYRDLQQLYLTGCGIEYIQVDTFIDNKKLKWLDIGKNKLKTIYDYTFRDLTLDHLFLNDNPGVSISTRAFGGLKSTGLYMQNNGLDKLSLEVLRPMNGTLKTLWLDGNKFERFNSLWLFLFKTLSHLRIGNNPLHCNCEARWLNEFYLSNSRIFEGGSPPSCRSPVRLRGKLFNQLQEDDFKCQLPVFKNVDVIFEHNVGKMTCLASGDPVPTIYWMKPDGDSEVFIPKSEDITKDMEGVMYVTPPEPNSKNRYECVANNPAGNVTFSINVAWPSVPEYQTDVDQSEVAMNDISADVKEINLIDKGDHKKKYNDVKTETKVSHVNTNSSKVTANDMQAVTQETSKTGVQFTAGDIVGAVVGTFLITLLLCIIVFHVFYRHQRKSGYPSTHQNGITTPDLRKGPPSRNELDEVEHTMLERRKFDIHV